MLRNLFSSGTSVNYLYASCMCLVTFCTCPQIINPPSLIPRSCWRREKWPGIHCAYMCNYPMVLGGIVNKLLTFSAMLTFVSQVFLPSAKMLSNNYVL